MPHTPCAVYQSKNYLRNGRKTSSKNRTVSYRRSLSEIFRRQTAALGGVLVSVSAVRITPDLSIAKVYLSIFPADKSQGILENIKKQTKTVRYELVPRW